MLVVCCINLKEIGFSSERARWQVLRRGLVKGPYTNPMRMFKASVLGETLPLMNLRLRPSISKVKDVRGSSQLTK